MHYFRYRHGSILSFKELLYNEIYFGSSEECNDPYDSMAFYEFPADSLRWRRLLEQSFDIADQKLKSRLLDVLVAHICSKPTISFADLMSKAFLNELPLSEVVNSQTLEDVERNVRGFVRQYIPQKQHFACFSTSGENLLMWSHYANHHRGFCLIFQAIDNKLKQHGVLSAKQVRRKTRNGLAPDMSYTLPTEFEFQQISYAGAVEPLNAFRCMNQHVYSEELSDDERWQLREEQNSHFLQKEQSWQYEHEYRIVLKSPPQWLFGEEILYSPHERLFHYQPTQLVGIIMGAKMSEADKKSVSEIINQKRREMYREKPPFILFDFVTFEAKMANNDRSIQLVPVEILGGAASLFPSDEQFKERLASWQNGQGLEFSDAGSARKIAVK